MTSKIPRSRPTLREAGGLLRRRGTEEHFATVLEMTDAAFDEVKELIRTEHPGYTEDQIHQAAVRQRVGDGVFKHAFRNAQG